MTFNINNNEKKINELNENEITQCNTPPKKENNEKEFEYNCKIFDINKINEILSKWITNFDLYETDETQKIIEKLKANILQGAKNSKSSKLNKKRKNPENNEMEEDKKHSKYYGNNILKKIKAKIYRKIKDFFNNALNLEKPEEKIKKLDYKEEIENLTKVKNLGNLNMILKDFFSNSKISSQYNKRDKNKKMDYNKEEKKQTVIKNIEPPRDENKEKLEQLCNEKKDNPIINFVMNLTIRNWIDIFTYKKELSDFIEKKEDEKLIKDKFERADKLLNEIFQKDGDIKYIHKFIIYLYNYENFFFIKKSRNRQKKYN